MAARLLRWCSCVATASAALAFAQSASAATVEVVTENGAQVIRYTAAPGNGNLLSFERAQGSSEISFLDINETVEPGPGCYRPEPIFDDRARCAVGQAAKVDVQTGDSIDQVQTGQVGIPVAVDTGDANDRIDDSAASESLNAGAGDDTIVSDSDQDEADDYSGGTGRDRILLTRADPLDISLDGQPGDGAEGEQDNFRSDLEVVSSGSGADTLTAGAGTEVLHGGGGDDHLIGSDGRQRLEGFTGNDLLEGRDGNDALEGFEGDDVLVGEEGNDSLDGEAGDDALEGQSGDDNLNGGTDDDLLSPGKGSDFVQGDYGVDLADYSDRTEPVELILDGTRNDGEEGENDLLFTDVEDLAGGDGDDFLSGDGMDNVLDGGLGADEIEGGDGLDAVDYFDRTAPVSTDLDGATEDDGEAGEGDSVALDVEGAFGGAAGDRLTGGGRDGFLAGAGGNDRLEDSGGEDILDGGSGDDRLFSRDSAVDVVLCDVGRDLITTDPFDEVSDCEGPNEAAGRPPAKTQPAPPRASLPLAPSDHSAPRVRLRVGSGQRIGRLARRGLAIAVRCNEPCRVRATLTAARSTRRQLRRLGLPAKAVLGRVTARSLRSGKRTLKLRLTRAGRKAARNLRSGRFSVAVVVSDRAGNRAKATRGARLRR